MDKTKRVLPALVILKHDKNKTLQHYSHIVFSHKLYPVLVDRVYDKNKTWHHYSQIVCLINQSRTNDAILTARR